MDSAGKPRLPDHPAESPQLKVGIEIALKAQVAKLTESAAQQVPGRQHPRLLEVREHAWQTLHRRVQPDVDPWHPACWAASAIGLVDRAITPS